MRSYSQTIMNPDHLSGELGRTYLVIPKSRFQDNISHTIRYARSQKRESLWYSPWNEALIYLCLSTSTGDHETRIRNGIAISLLLCPQWELVYRFPELPSTFLPLLPSGLSPTYRTILQEVKGSFRRSQRVCSLLSVTHITHYSLQKS